MSFLIMPLIRIFLSTVWIVSWFTSVEATTRRTCGVLCPTQLTSSFVAVKRVEQSFHTEDERMKVESVFSMYFKVIFSALLVSGTLVLGKVFL